MNRLFPILLFACLSACAEDDLTREAQDFITKHGETQEKWTAWWKVRAEELQHDHGYPGEEQAADGYLTAWFRDRQDKFKKPERQSEITDSERLVVCHFYLHYKARGWLIPERISGHVTRKNYERIFAADKQPGPVRP